MKLSALLRGLCLALCVLSGGADVARADLAPPPDPDCHDATAGTPCHDSRGLCQQETDLRGRTYIRCVEDGHPCDRLPLGAVCNPDPISHCRQFTGDRGETWRACQDDAVEAMRTAPATTETLAPHAPPASGTSANAASAHEDSSGCSLGLTGPLPSAGLALFALALALRLRRQR